MTEENGVHTNIGTSFDVWTNSKGVYHRLDGPAYIKGDHKEWYINGKLHRLDGPAIENAAGVKCWFLDGTEYSHEAWLFAQGIVKVENHYCPGEGKRGTAYLKAGKFHRLDGPAFLCREPNYNTERWFKEGKIHRDNNEPAILREWRDTGEKDYWYYVDGEAHRSDGPAGVKHFSDGRKSEKYWLNGKYLTWDDYQKAIKQKEKGKEEPFEMREFLSQELMFLEFTRQNFTIGNKPWKDFGNSQALCDYSAGYYELYLDQITDFFGLERGSLRGKQYNSNLRMMIFDHVYNYWNKEVWNGSYTHGVKILNNNRTAVVSLRDFHEGVLRVNLQNAKFVPTSPEQSKDNFLKDWLMFFGASTNFALFDESGRIVVSVLKNSNKKEEMKMSKDNEKSVGDAGSLSEALSEIGSLSWSGLKIGSVDKTGDVMLGVANDSFGDIPWVAMALKDPLGRVLIKYLVASGVIVGCSLTDSIPAKNTMMKISRKQVEFQAAKGLGEVADRVMPHLGKLFQMAMELEKLEAQGSKISANKARIAEDLDAETKQETTEEEVSEKKVKQTVAA